jgi:hydrogenase expression/formation protein HypD
MIDRGLAIAELPEVVFCTFGDMLRVPGSHDDLFRVRARGGDVRIVYSPLDAVQLALELPDRQVVFFGVGFETTAPAHAMAVRHASESRIDNFSLLSALVRVPPAIEAILQSPTNRVQAFLAAGHVCAVMGYWEYLPLSSSYGVPIVPTGFEPLDLAQGILMAVGQLEEGRAEVENQYSRAVVRDGNKPAQETIAEVFETCDRQWRGIGTIPSSGWRLRAKYHALDAEARFDVSQIEVAESEDCIAGLVLRGEKRPHECPAFGTGCTPTHPLGAPMVSSEGACAAYFRYRGENDG